MDSNRDGDISPDEFPGLEKQFRELDHNQDGFIDSQEVQHSFSTQQ
jgi:Ca2+-binding EF-hand superfamily protein